MGEVVHPRKSNERNCPPKKGLLQCRKCIDEPNYWFIQWAVFLFSGEQVFFCLGGSERWKWRTSRQLSSLCLPEGCCMIHPHNKWPGCVSYLESSQTNRLGIACRRSIEHNFTAVELLTQKSPKMPRTSCQSLCLLEPTHQVSKPCWNWISSSSRLCLQHASFFTPTWQGDDPILTNIFQMGWNHWLLRGSSQLDQVVGVASIYMPFI